MFHVHARRSPVTRGRHQRSVRYCLDRKWDVEQRHDSRIVAAFAGRDPRSSRDEQSDVRERRDPSGSARSRDDTESGQGRVRCPAGIFGFAGFQTALHPENHAAARELHRSESVLPRPADHQNRSISGSGLRTDVLSKANNRRMQLLRQHLGAPAQRQLLEHLLRQRQSPGEVHQPVQSSEF